MTHGEAEVYLHCVSIHIPVLLPKLSVFYYLQMALSSNTSALVSVLLVSNLTELVNFSGSDMDLDVYIKLQSVMLDEIAFVYVCV